MIFIKKIIKLCLIFLFCYTLSSIFLSQNIKAATYSIQDLGSLGNTSVYRGTSAAYGINASGQVTGVWSGSGGNGFVVTPLDTNTDGVSDQWYQQSAPYPNDNNALMENLGKPSINGMHRMQDINDSGVAVGYGEYSTGNLHGYVAEKTGTSWSLTDINCQIPGHR